jgi:hypothetical protein
MPPFSLPPTLVIPPGGPGPDGTHPGYSPFLRTPDSGATPHFSTGPATAPGGTVSGTQISQQAGGGPQMFAPTLAYVPVNLVSL